MYLYCTSLALHIWLNGPLYLLDFNPLTIFLRVQQQNRKMMNLASSICVIETFVDVSCLTNTKTCLSSCKKIMKQLQVVVK